MTRKGWTAVVVATVLMVAAIVLIERHDSGPTDMSPDLKAQVDRLADERDCVGLQAIFDATRDDAAGQLTYIDDRMRDAGCYDD